MSQPPITNYFNSKKRPTVEVIKRSVGNKVLIVEGDHYASKFEETGLISDSETPYDFASGKSVKVVRVFPKEVQNAKQNPTSKKTATKGRISKKTSTQFVKSDDLLRKDVIEKEPVAAVSSVNSEKMCKSTKTNESYPHINSRLAKLRSSINRLKDYDSKLETEASISTEVVSSSTKDTQLDSLPNQNDSTVFNGKVKESSQFIVNDQGNSTILPQTYSDVEKIHITPPSTPIKASTSAEDHKMKEIVSKMSCSSRLAELKASINRYKQLETKLSKVGEKLKKGQPTSPSIKNFKTVEFTIISPQKQVSPQKPYLSPRKETPARRNLISALNVSKELQKVPTKSTTTEETSHFTLPYKYRVLAEIFKSIDTVAQIYYNRKEMITFSNLKMQVENYTKRNLHEKHLSQIKHIFPDAFGYDRIKIKVQNQGIRRERWELIITPKVLGESMEPHDIIQRMRNFFSLLVKKVKVYHHEFLMELDPPMVIPEDKLCKWHPEFDIERVPDIEEAELPQAPEEKMVTSKDVLEMVREKFKGNSNLERALEKLQNKEESTQTTQEIQSTVPKSLLNGIPKAILEKVRQRQAAKALETMTRSASEEQEYRMYARFPELVRLVRNIFVSEKKNVLNVDIVADKIKDSLKFPLTRDQVEMHLRALSKELPKFIALHDVRNTVFVKVAKDADINLMIEKLNSKMKNR